LEPDPVTPWDGYSDTALYSVDAPPRRICPAATGANRPTAQGVNRYRFVAARREFFLIASPNFKKPARWWTDRSVLLLSMMKGARLRWMSQRCLTKFITARLSVSFKLDVVDAMNNASGVEYPGIV
jgi:hypothetical protein